MKRLQVFKDGEWQYVFCYNYNHPGVIVTTKDKRKALKERDLIFFQNKFGNMKFRAAQ